MDLSSIINPEFVSRAGDFAPLLIGIGVFLMGEVVILSCFIFAAQGWVGVPEVFIAAIIGTLCADFFWFYIGRYIPAIKRSKTIRTIRNAYDKHRSFLMSHPAFVLTIINYAYGFRWSTIIYYSLTNMSSRKYMLLDFLGTFIYVTTLAIVGLVTGKGIYNLAGIYHTTTLVIFAIIAGIVLSFVIRTVGRVVYKKITHIEGC